MTREPVLYVVATPIGNLADMVPRAVEVLKAVDLIAAEDTRHSKRLMQHFTIDTPMVAYHDHSDGAAVASLLKKMQQGESLALISDAGTPLISDPGYRLVDAAQAAGIKVVPIPGANAAIAALSAAGLPSDRFMFEGFLATKQQARLKQLQLLAEQPRTLIFYEAPHRLLGSLRDMGTAFGGDRVVVLAREITKAFETIHRAPLDQMVDWVASDSNQQRGECVLVVTGYHGVDELDAEARRILGLLSDELPLKQAAALAAKITGLKKNQLYQYGLERKQDS